MTAFKVPADNVNSCALVAAIHTMIEMKQWNEILRYMAANSPKEFISYVDNWRNDDGFDHLQKTQGVDICFSSYGGIEKKIPFIKAYRDLTKCGLAESKFVSENLPSRIGEFTLDSELFNKVKNFLNSRHQYIDYSIVAHDPKIKVAHTVAEDFSG